MPRQTALAMPAYTKADTSRSRSKTSSQSDSGHFARARHREVHWPIAIRQPTSSSAVERPTPGTHCGYNGRVDYKPPAARRDRRPRAVSHDTKSRSDPSEGSGFGSIIADEPPERNNWATGNPLFLWCYADLRPLVERIAGAADRTDRVGAGPRFGGAARRKTHEMHIDGALVAIDVRTQTPLSSCSRV